MLNQSGDPEQMQRITGAGKSVSEVSEKASEKVSGDRVHTVPDTFKRPADALYKVWVKMLTAGHTKPTVRPAREFVSKNLCRQVKSETLTPTQINIIVTGWFEKALSEGIIQENKTGGIGKPKYLLSGSNAKLGTQEHQFDMHLSGEGDKHVS